MLTHSLACPPSSTPASPQRTSDMQGERQKSWHSSYKSAILQAGTQPAVSIVLKQAGTEQASDLRPFLLDRAGHGALVVEARVL
eukprot:2838000-Pleurochrysis_carterae.AAC.1